MHDENCVKISSVSQIIILLHGFYKLIDAYRTLNKTENFVQRIPFNIIVKTDAGKVHS